MEPKKIEEFKQMLFDERVLAELIDALSKKINKEASNQDTKVSQLLLLNLLVVKVEKQNEKTDKIDSNVGALKEDVSTLKEDVCTLKEDVCTLKEDVSTLKEDVSKMVTKEEFNNQMGDLSKKFDSVLLAVKSINEIQKNK